MGGGIKMDYKGCDLLDCMTRGRCEKCQVFFDLADESGIKTKLFVGYVIFVAYMLIMIAWFCAGFFFGIFRHDTKLLIAWEIVLFAGFTVLLIFMVAWNSWDPDKKINNEKH
jgi:hypothetical protein